MTPAWEQQYRDALVAWLSDGSEDELERAYELGRAALDAGLGVLDILAVHQSAAPDDARIRDGVAFLAECLAPFEMVNRGYREANRALAEINTTLEQRVTERTAALAAAEERYRSLVEQLPGVIWRRSAEEPWALQYVSPQIRPMMGFTPEEWAVFPFSSRLHAEDRERVIAEFRRTATEGVPFRCEYRVLAHADRLVWVRDEARLYRDDSGNPAILQGIIVDVDDQKLLEEQLRRAQREESIGRLAGGVAHDFNNLLSIILGYTHLILRRLPEEDPTKRDLDEIRKAGERAAVLTSQLLAYSRRQLLQSRLVALGRLIEDMGGMLRRVIGEDIALETSFTPDPDLVRVDPGQMEQVLLNLVVNARDAMPDGGTLRLSTRRTTLDEEAATALGMASGPSVVLSVQDTGMGMTEAVRERVFEPFFTTKAPGKGTGLGLATSYGIARQSGGAITVQSEPGRGSTFEVWLPAAEEGAAQAEAEADPSPEASNGAETILLVEDEPAVRKVTRRMLRERGYHVLQASQGLEALAVAAAHDGPIHLLLTDVIMPGMSGKVLAERLVALRPDTRVLFTSGYDEEAVARGMLDSDVPLLQKPVTPDVLAQRVRQILDN